MASDGVLASRFLLKILIFLSDYKLQTETVFLSAYLWLWCLSQRPRSKLTEYHFDCHILEGLESVYLTDSDFSLRVHGESFNLLLFFIFIWGLWGVNVPCVGT